MNIISYDYTLGFVKKTEDSCGEFVMDNSQEEHAMDFSAIAKHIKWLQGEILTIAEASIDNENKLKATKSLISKSFSDKLDWIYQMCGKPLSLEIGEASIEE